MNHNGLHWQNSPADHGPHKTFCDRWFGGSKVGSFARILLELDRQQAETEWIMMDATDLKAHRPPAEKSGAQSVDRAHQGSPKYQAACGL